MKQVAIVDYGVGNLRSVMRGLEKAGASTITTADPGVIGSVDGIVLPGVGAFREGMDQLGELQQTVVNAARKVPLLGICLGMQMLTEWSEEHGLHPGLGLVPGHVRRFPFREGFKVPHMGWNTIRIVRDDPLFSGIREEYVYFVHSYYADVPSDHALATTEYSRTFASAIGHDLVRGVQFHPEKSGRVGLAILNNFIQML